MKRHGKHAGGGQPRSVLRTAALWLALLLCLSALSACNAPSVLPSDTPGETGEGASSPSPAADVPPTEAPADISAEPSESAKPTADPPKTLEPFDEEIDAFALARDMGAGWNLGNTLDAGGDGKMPVTPSAHETAWGNPVTTPEMIALLADTGFRTLRIPVTWQRHIGPAPDYVIEEVFLDRVQEVVDYGIDSGLYVIINLHHEEWHFPSSDNEEAPQILSAVWRQIAGRFAGYSEKLIFEMMNEPRMKGTPEEWSGGNAEARSVINSWNYTAIRAVRDTGYNNEKRFLMIPTIAASGDPAALKDFYIPKDKRVLVSIHAYTPYNLALNTGSPKSSFDPADPADTADIDALFERLEERFISQGTAVVIGETGCLNKGENTAARAAWADYYTKKAAALGIPCLWWDNGVKASSGSGEAFGIMNRLENTWWFPEIAEAMVQNYLR